MDLGYKMDLTHTIGWLIDIDILVEKDVIQMTQAVVQAMVEDELKAKAQEELEKQGLTLSDFITMALREVAAGRKILSEPSGMIGIKDQLDSMKKTRRWKWKSSMTVFA